MRQRLSLGIALWIVVDLAGSVSLASHAQPRSTSSSRERPDYQGAAAATGSDSRQALLKRYCITCHNERLKTGNLALDALDLSNVGAHAPVWEKVVRKLRAGVMPPAGRPRPDEATTTRSSRGWKGSSIRRRPRPDPGRTETFHRLNRTEYQNAIRDLLSIDMDIADLLPADDSSYGFDNIAGVLHISPALMERYLSAAKTISRLAVGAPLPAVDHEVYRVAADAQQHDRVEDLPLRHARRHGGAAPVPPRWRVRHQG